MRRGRGYGLAPFLLWLVIYTGIVYVTFCALYLAVLIGWG